MLAIDQTVSELLFVNHLTIFNPNKYYMKAHLQVVDFKVMFSVSK